MDLKDLRKTFPEAASGLWTRMGIWACVIALIVMAVMEGGLWYLRSEVGRLWLIGEVVLIPVSLLTVALGFLTARTDDPIRKLFEQQNAVKAPYLLACAAALWQNERVSDREKRAALKELSTQLDPLKNEIQYIHQVIEDIKTHSVWAVCGKKTDATAPSFYDANAESYGAGNYIERMFFPPINPVEADSIKFAIERHFKVGMLVRALKPKYDADDVRQAHNFPPGFGMTLMAEGKRYDGNDERNPDPGSLFAVLIHWGGLGSSAIHVGVVLRHPAWLDYFWRLFEEMRGVTTIVEPHHCPWTQFTTDYPEYL